MHPTLRAALAAALLILCGTPAARPQATNLPAAVTTSLGVTTAGVVKAPVNSLWWPTQTNYLHRATITNLTAVTAASTGTHTIGTLAVTGNSTLTGTLGVTGLSTLASAAVTGNATVGGTLNVTGTTTVGVIAGVSAAEVTIADAGTFYAGTDVEAALQEIGPSLGGGPFLPLTGGTLSGALLAQGGFDTYGGVQFYGSSGGVDATPLLALVFKDLDGTEGDYAKVEPMRFNGNQGKLIFYTSDNAGIMQTNLTLGPGQNAVVVGDMSATTITGTLTDAELGAIQGLTSAADRLPYFTGSGTASLATFSSAGRALVDDADAAAQRDTLNIPRIVVALFAHDLSKIYTTENIGWVEEEVYTNRFTAVGFESAEGTLRSGETYWQFEVPTRADGTAASWADGAGEKILRLRLIGDNTAATENKISITVFRMSSDGQTATTLYGPTDWDPTAANTIETWSIEDSDLSNTTLTAGQTIQVSVVWYSKSNNSVKMLDGKVVFK